jgi:diguanylate cyclase (GGDEF)-like protein
MLTGVMNRNEMNNYVDSLCAGLDENGKVCAEKHSVGVFFADLNGLKTVNDRDGHNAGDKLLKDAASALREIFDESTIFRAGGDEFSIIVKGIEKDELVRKIEMIRATAEKYDRVHFAIGGAWEEDSRNVRVALRHADEQMYEDKKRYYEEHPEKKGR